MTAYVDDVGDLGDSAAVADIPHPRGALAQSQYIGPAARDLVGQFRVDNTQAISAASALPEAVIFSIWAGGNPQNCAWSHKKVWFAVRDSPVGNR